MQSRRLKISKPVKEKQPSSTIKHINVTNMNQNKRRSIVINCMNRNGFKGFVKYEQNSQTYYFFIYKEAL